MCIGLFSFLTLYKTNRFHVAVGVFSNRSQRTSKCGKNISDTLACGSLFLPHFDVICSLRTADVFPVVASGSLPPKNSFAARVHIRYFSEGEKRRPEMRLLLAGYVICDLFSY